MLELIRRITLKNSSRIKHESVKFNVGDTLEVSVKVREGEKERIQLFKGVVMKIYGSGNSRSFVVRKISDGIGVERTFPLASPSVDKIKVVSRGTVRRARLYYLRGLEGKAARIDSEQVVSEKAAPKVPKAPAAQA